MTVIIGRPTKAGDMAKLAANLVDREIEQTGNKSYDTDLRQQAVDCLLGYEPAYIRLTDYSDQLGTNAAIWAMGGKLGVPNLDPTIPLRGLRQVASHIAGLWPDTADEKLRKVLRNLKPVNAMAQLDRELLLGERGINAADVDWNMKKEVANG